MASRLIIATGGLQRFTKKGQRSETLASDHHFAQKSAEWEQTRLFSSKLHHEVTENNEVTDSGPNQTPPKLATAAQSKASYWPVNPTLAHRR